jgi:pimeloyl-ACP methyl ester carboxylesterase
VTQTRTCRSTGGVGRRRRIAGAAARRRLGSVSAVSRPLPEVPGVRHADVHANGVRLHVAEAGEGDPLVLLHGWPQHWWMWREVIGPLAESHRVICPDLRGFGWSDAPPGDYDKETLARDMLALLDELGVERAGVMGHDWGGWTGFLMALFAPERVERLLAINIAHPFPSRSPSVPLAFWRLWYQVPIAAPVAGPHVVRLLASLQRHPVAAWIGIGPDAWSDEERRVFLDQLEEPARARASAALYRTFMVREVPRVLSGRYGRMRLTVPTLLVRSTGDQVVADAFVRGFEPYAADMRLERVPGYGHFVVDEAPELVVERARSFFGSDGGRG